MIDYVMIGKRIKEVRTQLEVSQAELAESVDLSESYISLVENGKKKVSLKALVDIAEVLGATVDELLCGSQINFSGEYFSDIDLLLADCSNYEKRVIFEISSAMKNSLRENHRLL